MRATINNSNGFLCDMCGSQVLSEDAVHFRIVQLCRDKAKAKTGRQESIGKMDLCNECYTSYLLKFVQPPRPRCKKLNKLDDSK